ncbi:MAG TPA: beta-ketoacyl-ACP synthase II [Thermomicrobiales bacterium]|jgi:3-oxoacyl-[acyl-carrier-protein] synthase II|nr:beta-ketoacyl-ACP synthase II [Thermomicrobiales bacterium]
MTSEPSSSSKCPVCGAPITATQPFCGACGSGLHGQRTRTRRRVVVTGLGAVCAVGLSARESWGNILDGKSGIKRIPLLAEGNYSCQVRGDLEESHLPNRFLDPKTARNTSQFSLWLLEAAGSALISAGLIDADGNPLLDLLPGGSVIGTCVGGSYDDLLPAYDTFNTRGPDKLSPHLHVKFPLNMASYTVQWRFGMGGPSNTVSTACATGTQAIGEAFHVVQSGIAPLMVAGATESTVHPMGVAGFSAMRALVTDSNEDPERALRPFDATRAGFALGEGAGALVLEDYEFAKARGARVFAEIVGFASSNDIYHPIAPQPNGVGAARAMIGALADAGVAPDQIGHIQAHAASTPAGDLAEARAIHQVYGERAASIPIMSVKGNIGHCMGGAGAIETAMGILSLAEQVIPPTANYRNPDPEIGLDIVSGEARPHSFDYMAKHGFGLGGQNACLIIKRAPDEFAFQTSEDLA